MHAHICNSRAPPTTSWKVICTIGEIKFGEIFVPIHTYSMSRWRNFVVYGTQIMARVDKKGGVAFVCNITLCHSTSDP